MCHSHENGNPDSPCLCRKSGEWKMGCVPIFNSLKMKFEEGLNWNGRKYEGKSLGKNAKGFPLLKLRMYEKFFLHENPT
jgi:hypothetical protein